MHTAGIAELKASLSENLARVKAGEEILVTEHGRPIARIVPLSPAAPEAATGELIRAGILRAPQRTAWDAFWSLPRPEATQGSTLQALLDERRDGR
jgi:prevent-host-death family protein